MTNLLPPILPPKKNIRNFKLDDIEGKALFNGAANALQDFFAKPLTHDLAKSIPYVPEGAKDTTYQRISHSLSAIFHLHEQFQKLIGESRRYGAEVPTMCYFSEFVDHKSKYGAADKKDRALAAQMNNDRPFEPEDLSKVVFKNLLLECAILNRGLQKEDAFSAFQEMLHRQQHQVNSVFLQCKLAIPMASDDMTDEHKFSSFRTAVAKFYSDLQSKLGVAIPQEAVEQLVERPIDAVLSISSLDDIRQQFFKLPEQAQGSFASRFLMPNNSNGRHSLG